MAVLVYFSGQFNFTDGLLGAFTIKVALSKVSLSFETAFVSGILCNVFVCMAVLMAGSVLAIIPMIIIFVIFQKQFINGVALSGGK